MGGGVGDEEDGGGDSGGIATGTQKRGSKQGEALTSACFTLERERERWTDGKAGPTARRGEEHREQQNVKRQDIRRVQYRSATRRGQQSVRSRTHKAAGRGQTAATRRHHCSAQAASDSPQVPPVVRLRPQSPILQQHRLQSYKTSVRCWNAKPRACEGHQPVCHLFEVGGVTGAVCPVRTPLHVCVGGLGASLPSHPG